jgi:hypothetical protein
VLSDATRRAAYDAALASEAPVVSGSAAPQVESRVDPRPPRPQAAEDVRDHESATRGHRFEQELAGRDYIVRRAVMTRVRDVLREFLGECDERPIRGFDLACLARANAPLFRKGTPLSVVVRLTPVIDAAAAAEAWRSVVKSRLTQRPLALLLIGNELASTHEISQAIEEGRRKSPELADAVFPVAIDLRDWTARIPANAPNSVRGLIEKLRTYVS